ncbi:MAG TPA: hypothetical protein VGK41_07580, partial [Solirubrobacterales bacterium]
RRHMFHTSPQSGLATMLEVEVVTKIKSVAVVTADLEGAASVTEDACAPPPTLTPPIDVTRPDSEL